MSDTVLMHGFTGSSDSWGSTLLDGLAGVVGPLVLADLPGHGRHRGETDPLCFTLTRVCEDLATRTGPEPANIVGYSMGGRLALSCAVRQPARVARLVLESASPGIESASERAARRASDDVWVRMLETEGIAAFVAAWERQPILETHARLREETRAAVRAARLRNDPRSLAAALRGLGSGSLSSLWDDLAFLTMPVLLIAGAEDRKYVEIARRMASLIPRARLAVVAGAGHTVHLERPDAWMEVVTSFLVTTAS